MHSAGGKSDSPPFTIPKTAPRPKTLSVLLFYQYYISIINTVNYFKYILGTFYSRVYFLASFYKQFSTKK